jgi:hypothetical protein
VLAEHAAELGVVVERGVELTGMAQDEEGVEVRLRTRDGERTSRVGWVVGADGGHSRTRELLGARLEGSFHGAHFAIADVDVDTPWSPDTIRTFAHPDGVAALFPLSGARARLIFFIESPGEGELTLEQIQVLASARMGAEVTVRNPRWLTYFEVHHGQVARYRYGRVFLAGDAAHIHSPIGGQGMNTGIQDAANLAWKLALVAKGRATSELLDSYHDERHPIGAAVIRVTTLLTDVMTGSGPEVGLRDLVLFLVEHCQPIRHLEAAELAELTIDYRHSPLSTNHGHRPASAARAGEHAPDPEGLQCPDGTDVAVEDLLARPGMLVLAFTDDPGAVSDLRGVVGDLGTLFQVVRTAGTTADVVDSDVVVDPRDVMRRYYGLKDGGLAVVRPDGYLGLLATTTDSDVLRHYLTDILHVVDGSHV